MRNIDENVLKAQNDSTYIENFMNEYETFILHTASKATGRYITKSDDQWSISLSAFHEAIQAYSYDKGAFLSFAETVIRRRLIDYIKKQSKHFCELPIDSYTVENDTEQYDYDTGIKLEVSEKMVLIQNDDPRLEIEAITSIIKEYGFSFFDLADVSPKAYKTKKICAKAIIYLSENAILMSEMRRTKTLPLKTIEKNKNLPRKILERHRKYIIAGAEIISGDYPILSEYLKFVKEEKAT